MAIRKAAAVLLVGMLQLFPLFALSQPDSQSRIRAGRSSSGKLLPLTMLTVESLSAIPERDIVETRACYVKKAIVEVSLKRGIGSCRLKFAQGYRPSELEIGFKSFSNLESLVLESGSLRASSSLKMSPVLELESAYGIRKSRLLIQKSPGYGIKVLITCRDILGKDNEVKVSWIDAYR